MRSLQVMLMVLLGGVGACRVGDGRGAAAGTLYVRNCSDDKPFGSLAAPAPFNLRPVFFVADPVNDSDRLHPMNRLAIRVQSSGARVEEADVIYLNIATVFQVAVAVGSPLPLGPATNVRASMVLNETCPSAEAQLELDGTLTFSRFGSAGEQVPDDFRIEFGDHLTATFSVDIVDRRALTLGGFGGVSTTPTVGGHLDGDFDFIVRQGQSAQAYP